MAASETPTALATCPTDEDLAAYLDGMLAKPERARITAHLADCESCYEIFAGAAHFMQESAPAETAGRIVPFPSHKDGGGGALKRWGIPAAAAAVLAVGVGLAGYRMYEPKIMVTELTEPFAGQPDVEKHFYNVTFRGGEDDGGDLLSQSPAFMTGVYLVDLRLAEKSTAASADILRRIYARLHNIPFMEKEANEFLQDANQLEKAPTPEILHRIAAGLPMREANLDENLPSAFAFGKWAEAGRIAAETRSPGFFKSWTNQRFLSRLLKEPENFEEGAVEPAEAIRKIWDRGDLQAKDYDKLAEHFGTILRTYDI
jgi:Putative zinc-finger